MKKVKYISKTHGKYSSYIQFNKNKINPNNNKNDENTFRKRGKSQTLILPYQYYNQNNKDTKLIKYESFNLNNQFYPYDNDISNSSTFNSSGMTKLIDNNIHYSKFLDINNNTIHNLKYSNKILGNIKRKEIKTRTSNLELQNFNEEYNNFHNQELNTERLNFPKLNPNINQTFIPFRTERTPIQNYNRFYHSRNLTNTNNPIKIISIDENFNTLTKTDDSIKNKSNLSTSRHHSRIKSMRDLNSNLNKYFRSNSLKIDYKNELIKTNEKRLNYAKRRTVTFVNHKSKNEILNEIDKSNSNPDIKYNGYIPNFKRIKRKSKSKQFIKKKVTKFITQLSKISESDNSKVFMNPIKLSLKKSISINQRKSIIHEKEEIEKSKLKHIRKTSFEYTTKNVIKSFYENDFFHKRNNLKNTSESEDSGDCHDSDRFIINSEPNEEDNLSKKVFFLKYIQSSHNLISLNKKKNKLFKFEEQIKEDFYVINGNYSQYKIRIIDNFINEFKNKIKENEKELHKNLEDRINKNKSNTEYLYKIKENKKLKKSILHFQKHTHSILKKQTINLNQLFNYSFSNSYLLYNYLSLDISRIIFKEKYLYDLRENYSGSIFKNFSIKNGVLKRASMIEERGSIISLISNMNKIKYLTKKDSSFLLHFYQFDYEYNIIPGFFSVKLEKIKLKIDMNEFKKDPYECNTKQKKKGNEILNKRSIKEIFFDENPLNNEKRSLKTERLLLKNALLKNYFYNRVKRKKTHHSTLQR